MEPGFFQISLKVFLRRDGAFLVLRDQLTQLGDLPGGRLGQDELYGTWTEAVHRELTEELGPDASYLLHPEPLFTFPYYIPSAGTDALGVAYVADYLGGSIHLSEEHDAAHWVSIDQYDPADHFSDHIGRAVRRFQRLTAAGTLAL
ncbi:MAG: NUDIX hydrolase [Bacteroidota bacterium]